MIFENLNALFSAWEGSYDNYPVEVDSIYLPLVFQPDTLLIPCQELSN